MINYLSVLSLLTGLFPFVTIVSFGTDIQPWNVVFLVIMAMVIFNNSVKINRKLVDLFIPMALALVLILISIDDLFSYVRSLLGYVVITLSPIVYYYIIDKNFNQFLKILRLSTYVWLGSALIQYFVDPSMFGFLINRISGGGIRGVVSLSPEPTFYGIVGIFYILIFLAISYRKNQKYIFLWIFQIFFLAQSSMAILFVIIFMFYLLIFKSSVKLIFSYIFLVIFAVTALFFIDINEYTHIRAVSLYMSFLENGIDIANLDASINDRWSAIYFSLMGLLDNYLLPNGMASYAGFLSEQIQHNDYFWWISVQNRIMSYYGSILFELGIIGLIVPFVYSNIIFRAYSCKKKTMLLYFVFINTILFSAIQLSFPLVGMYMATLLYKIKNENPGYS